MITLKQCIEVSYVEDDRRVYTFLLPDNPINPEFLDYLFTLQNNFTKEDIAKLKEAGYEPPFDSTDKEKNIDNNNEPN
jgi:hypothetical protein